MSNVGLQALLSKSSTAIFDATNAFLLKLKPATAREANPTPQQAMMRSYYARAVSWLQTLRKLDSADDFQAAAACTRALMEIAVDMLLLHKDPANIDLMEAWNDSAEYAAHESFKAYSEATGKLGNEYQESVATLAAHEARVMAGRVKLWAALQPDRKKKLDEHPGRWTKKLHPLVKELTEIPACAACQGGVNLWHFYVQRNNLLCWYVHGQGHAGLRHGTQTIRDAFVNMVMDSWLLTLLIVRIVHHVFDAAGDPALRVAATVALTEVRDTLSAGIKAVEAAAKS